jgi:DNA-binding response OmpR family regulator
VTIPPKIEVVAIDDDPSMLDYVDGVVAQAGVRVSRFSDPLQGWDFIQRIRPDIVILDQLMPGMDGMELLRRIIEWDPTIDVVLLSGE